MKRFIAAMVVVSVGLIGFAADVWAQAIQEGQWTMTMVMTMPGTTDESSEMMEAMENMSPEEKAMMQQMMGGVNIQMGSNSAGFTTTVTQCLTNEDPVPTRAEDEDCQSTHTTDNNTVNFETVCSDSVSTGQIVYSENSMSGVITSKETVEGKESEVTININGQYVGPCS